MLEESKNKKCGVNNKPQNPKPDIHPPAQKPFDKFEKIINNNEIFQKSKLLAPDGYRFICNETKTNESSLYQYILDGYLIYPDAYDLIDNIIENNVGIYRKMTK